MKFKSNKIKPTLFPSYILYKLCLVFDLFESILLRLVVSIVPLVVGRVSPLPICWVLCAIVVLIIAAVDASWRFPLSLPSAASTAPAPRCTSLRTAASASWLSSVASGSPSSIAFWSRLADETGLLLESVSEVMLIARVCASA